MSDTKESINWLSSNRGFVSLVTGIGSVVFAIVCATYWASSVANSFDKRTTVNEMRLEVVEELLAEVRGEIKTIDNEQLRRTTPVSDIKAIGEQLKQLQEQLKRDGYGNP